MSELDDWEKSRESCRMMLKHICSQKEIEYGKDGFTYGDMTSVAISLDGIKLAAALQDAAYNKTGLAAVFTCKADGSLNPQGNATRAQLAIILMRYCETITR